MFVRKKKNRSGSTSVIVVEKTSNKYKEHITIGISSDENEIERLVEQGKEWIRKYQSRHSPELDLYGEETEAKRKEVENTHAFLSNIENILVNGDQLILDRIFDKVGFNQIEDDVFRKLVQSRLSCPSSKAATVEYLKNHFDEDVDLSKIYRYLDRLNHTQQDKVQDISVHHTRRLLGGNIGVMFYDVTTLYFEADREDELRKTGFSKEGRHKNPQIILGLGVLHTRGKQVRGSHDDAGNRGVRQEVQSGRFCHRRRLRTDERAEHTRYGDKRLQIHYRS